MSIHTHSKRQSHGKKKSPWRKVGKRLPGLFQYVPSGTYFAWVQRRGTLYRESLKTKDLEFAKRKLAALKQRLDRTEPKYGRITLVRWLEENYAPTLRGAASTITNKRCIIARIKETWLAARNQPLRDLRPSDVERWLTTEFGQWSEAYWNSAVTVIRDACDMAVRDRVISESPAAALTHRKRKKPIRLTPTFEQFKAIIADVRSQPFNRDADDSGDFLEACGLLGLGQSELAGMRREHVDLESSRIVVYRYKTDTGFVIPIYPQARALVERLCAGKKHSALLFPIVSARKALSNACTRLELPQYTHRSLRRMFVTRCLELGIDVKTVAEFQGHKDGGKLILDTYSHVRQPHAQRMAALLTTETPDNVVPVARKVN